MKKLILIGLLLLIGFFWGPDLIHFYYSSRTLEIEIIENRDNYNNLALKNKGILKRDSKKDYQTMDSLYLWFHVRGLAIDEDHNAKSVLEQWGELLEYWKL